MRKRELNNNWKGGRRITSHGYIEVKVDEDHPLRNANGYAYEHRVVAMEILGRPLKDNEIAHHKDLNKQNNAKSNIKIVQTNREHFFEHRSGNSDRIKPCEENKIIQCFCGCGKSFLKYDSYGRPRKYVPGHNNELKKYYCDCGCGEVVSGKQTKYKSGHRPNRFGKRKIDISDKIFCACGCGNQIDKFDKYGRIRKYISGHNN